MSKKINGMTVGFGVCGCSANFGLSWVDSQDPKAIISGLYAFLEARRLLINPAEMEIVDECIISALEIKRSLVEVSQKLVSRKVPKDVELIQCMIDACNKFLDALSSKNKSELMYKADGDRWEDNGFDKAMKTFRSAFRTSILSLSEKYKIEFREEIPEKF